MPLVRRRWGPIVLVLGMAGCAQQYVAPLPPVPEIGADAIDTRLYLIGDAGAPNASGEPVLTALGRDLDRDPGHSLVVYLGDNVYPRGLPDSSAPDYPDMARRLDAQVDLLVQRQVRGFMIPGNHDWDRFGPDGWNAIMREGDHVDARGKGFIRMLPKAGCPGPVTIDRGEKVRLVLLDTQWWLQKGKKPELPGLGCHEFDETRIQESIRMAVEGGGDRHVVVLGHHPMRSGGEHGGFFDWREHFFPLRHVKKWLWLPLPVLGSIFPLARDMGVTSQDLTNSTNQRMVRAFAAAFADRPPLVYGSGHDHGLQVLQGGPAKWLLVSGAGIYDHEGAIARIEGTQLALQKAGYMRLDLLADGRVRLGVITVEKDGTAKEVLSTWLVSEAREPLPMR